MKRETLPRRKATVQAATRGVHHLALTTEDMRTTADFYTRVVGLQLSDRAQDIVVFMRGQGGSDQKLRSRRFSE